MRVLLDGADRSAAGVPGVQVVQVGSGVETQGEQGGREVKRQEQGEIVIEKLTVGEASVWIKGQTPMIYNSMSAKVKHELLMPKGRKTTADKAQNLKHDPVEEFRASVYRARVNGPTTLVFPCGAVKSAMCNAALEIPGAKKAQVGRLVWVEGESVDVYGVPHLLMSVTRSADMNKTPDVRTRAILPEWCCRVTVRFVMPTMNETTVARLLETAGLVIGLGDFRQEKGKGNYGQFALADEAECKAIIAKGGKAVQDKALENPVAYDPESKELLEWYVTERKARGR